MSEMHSSLLFTPRVSWNMALAKMAALGGAAHTGFHWTQLETVVGICASCVMAAIAVLTFYDRIRRRRRSSDRFAQARAAKHAQDELSAVKGAIIDADRELARLAAFRMGHSILPYRELRLPRGSFASDKRLFEAHQERLSSFDGACRAALGHITEFHRLVPDAERHDPTAFRPDVMQALVSAESAFKRILEGERIPLQEAEQLIAPIKSDFPGEESPGQPGRTVPP
jgi:hypothetical protein